MQNQLLNQWTDFLKGKLTVLENGTAVISFGTDGLYLLAMFNQGAISSGCFHYSRAPGEECFEIAFRFIRAEITEISGLGNALVFWDTNGQSEYAPITIFPPEWGYRFWVNASGHR